MLDAGRMTALRGVLPRRRWLANDALRGIVVEGVSGREEKLWKGQRMVRFVDDEFVVIFRPVDLSLVSLGSLGTVSQCSHRITL